MEQHATSSGKLSRQSAKGLPMPLSMAKRFAQDGIYDEAERYCHDFLNANPNNPHALRILSSVYEQARQFNDVIDVIDQYEQFHSKSLNLCTRKARAFSALYQHDNAIAAWRECVSLSKGSVKSLNRLAMSLSRAGEPEEALSIYETIFAKNKKNISVYLSYATLLIELGRNDNAIELLRHVLKLEPRHCHALVKLANIKSFRFSNDELEAMAKLESQRRSNPRNAIYLCLALGKAFEDKQDYDKSFSYYARAKTIKAKRHPSDPEEFENQHRHIIETIDDDFFKKRKDFGCSNDGPIFILGLHRSGSTLIEQILSSHSQVDATRELPYIPGLAKRLSKAQREYSISSARYARALAACDQTELQSLGEEYLRCAKVHRQNAYYFIDKKPENFIHIGLICTILPNAKIIDARRHPLAVGFSIYRQMFSSRLGHTNKLFDIGRYYGSYLKLMKHWHSVLPGKLHRVQYEEMVDDTEKTIRQLLDYCGLPFEEACLEFYNNKRPIKTPSAEQVRQPIYKDAVEQWKHYEQYLEPLKEGLGDSLDIYLND